MQVLERALAVVEGADGVDHQDDIERPAQFTHQRAVLDVADDECELRMCLACLGDHALAEIDTHAIRWTQLRQQVAAAASKLEHASPFADQKLEIEKILSVKEGRARKPFPPLWR